MTTKNQPSGNVTDLGDVLLDRSVEDAYSFLGIQAERLDIAQSRQARSMAVPAWSDQDAYDKVISGQRASLADIKRYADRGAQFATETLKKIEPQLREILCEDGKIRMEISGLEGDAKALVGLVSGSIAGALVTVIPAAAAGAVASIATVLTVIIIKNQVERFCKQGVAAVEQPGKQAGE